MIRNMKALSLALFAVLALGATVVSSAAAAGEKGHCEVEPCIVTGETETGTKIEFTSGETAISCLGKLEGTASEKTGESGTGSATYSSCNLNSHIRSNHCAYLATASTTGGTAAVHFQCASGSKLEMEITDLGCTLKFGEQTPSGGVHYTNIEGRVTAEENMTNITFEKVGGFGCLFIGSQGSVKAKGTIKCYEDKGSALSGTELTTPSGNTSEGKEVGCSIE